MSVAPAASVNAAPASRATRIVFLDQTAEIAGAQTVLLEMLTLALESGFEVALAIPLGGALEARVRKQFGTRVALHALSLPAVSSGRKTPRDLWRIGAAAARTPLPGVVREAEIVHVNGPRLYAAWWWANRRTQTPTLYHVHLAHAPLERWFIRQVLLRQSSARVVANSPSVWQGLGGAAEPRLALVGNALPRGFHALGFEDRWGELPLRCVTIGALSRAKGQDQVLAAARALPEVEFHLAGPDGAGERTYADALRRDAPSNVRFHGAVSDVRSWISRVGAHCVVVPSLRPESFGLVAVEGMACSALALVAARGGLQEIAAATQALTFTRSDDLVALLRDLLRRGASVGRELARAQYDAVNARYAPLAFESAVAALWEAAAPRGHR